MQRGGIWGKLPSPEIVPRSIQAPFLLLQNRGACCARRRDGAWDAPFLGAVSSCQLVSHSSLFIFSSSPVASGVLPCFPTPSDVNVAYSCSQENLPCRESTLCWMRNSSEK